MKLQNKTKHPPKQNQNHCCLKKKKQHSHQLYSNKIHKDVCTMCFFSISWWLAPFPCKWWSFASALGPSSCRVWRLLQLLIIRRLWMEDSKVLKSRMVMASSMPVVQNLRQSCLPTSLRDTWVMLSGPASPGPGCSPLSWLACPCCGSAPWPTCCAGCSVWECPAWRQRSSSRGHRS